MINLKNDELAEVIINEKSKKLNVTIDPSMKIELNVSFDRFDELKNMSSMVSNISAVVDSNEELLENLTLTNAIIQDNHANVD